MCGICGKVYAEKNRHIDHQLISAMMDSIIHRGPDDSGYYVKRQVGLGHRRLSIIDLKTGHQPISNEDETIWIVYNGEIYNYVELRNDLLNRGHIFKTHTDTEVIIHLYEEYGDEFLSKLAGMFAFALWDDRNQRLLLARDRVGIKPLYYCINDESILFASEIKAILADSSIKSEVNLAGIDKFLTYLYLPGSDTLLKNIVKLKPAHYLIYHNGNIKIKKYWDLHFSNSKIKPKFNEKATELIEVLKDTVDSHLISDVPVGFLLSGGVDSTALLSYAVEKSKMDISSFTIGFADQNFADERYYAKIAAQKFGTKHYDITISASDFLNFLPAYTWHMEEPVNEAPAIALYYVTKLAKDYVKVVISGEGGDEAFAGYPNYRNLVWLERLKKLPNPITRLISFPLLKNNKNGLLKKLNKYARLMNLPLEKYYYSRTANPFSYFNSNKNELYTNGLLNETDKAQTLEVLEENFAGLNNEHVLNKMLYIDSKTWLPDDLLIKADKITMANSIELRVPLLDHKVLEFAAALPVDYKLRGMSTKYILKKAFEYRVPAEIINRKKTGFPVPDVFWFRNELKSLPSEILLDKRTIERGYFKRNIIEGIIKDNLNGFDYSQEIFSLMVLELWHRIFIDKEIPTLT